MVVLGIPSWELILVGSTTQEYQHINFRSSSRSTLAMIKEMSFKLTYFHRKQDFGRVRVPD